MGTSHVSRTIAESYGCPGGLQIGHARTYLRRMASSDIPIRLEKLRFLVDDLRLTSALSGAAPDAWSGRLIARHVLVRAYDVVAHSRGLRRLVQPFGSIQAFNEAKETYATWFDEYFKTTRHKLSAHVQDLDFGRRIELWNDVEAGKIGVFVDGAAQIYEALSGLGLPGYAPLPAAPAEIGDAAFAAALIDFRASAAAPRAEFAADPLGMTRPGTLSGMGTTPLHERASQLALIARWIAWDQAVLDRFSAFPRVRRILQARLVTDVVSFADCLVTRPVAAGALQALTGLDDLLAAEGGPSEPLTAFLRTYRFEQAVDRLRPARNKFGAHLDDDPTMGLSDVLALFDALDWSDVPAVAETLRTAFRAACHERVYLISYLADGEEIRGAVPRPSDTVTAYDPTAPAAAWPRLTRPGDRSEGDLRAALSDWLGPDADRAEVAAEMFRAVCSGNTGEAFVLEHAIGSGQRWEHHTFTRGHRVLLDELSNARTPEEVGRLLELLLRASRNHPVRAAEVLVRFAAEPGAQWQWPGFCRALGEVAAWDAPSHLGPLRAAARPDEPWDLRRAAILGQFGCFVRFEGVLRVNSGGPTLDLTRDIEPLLASTTPHQRLELRLAMVSAFCAYGMDIFVRAFETEFRALHDDLHALVRDELGRQGRPERSDAALKLIAHLDMVGVVLLLTEPSPGPDVRELLGLVQDGTIVPARHDLAGRHLACCLWLAGDIERALTVATRLTQRQPGSASYELLRLEILTNHPGCKEEVMAGAVRLRRDFDLSAEELARVSAIEASPEPT
ncbi:hypothetical protein [Methylobacterium flocculans]|uniref:hypothetical protein n=1 Tax=Methylobacterium flocculans TaxID=2984843 RepID=UPI0021F2C8F8|nr:hypothetical protein [Methylobacterium sp. FF17]